MSSLVPEEKLLIIIDKKLRLREFYTKNSTQTALVEIIIFFLPVGYAGCKKLVHERKFSLRGFLTPL